MLRHRQGTAHSGLCRNSGECARVVKAGGVVAFTDWLETGPMTDEEWMALHAFMVFPYMETLDGYAALVEAAGLWRNSAG